mmetsp:Transcript_25901/g.56260  ORF Transcript_25901/g.56260 Transcript_25901/m.56260 type:complete len:280 (+) Transcript_25901:198-1037(+)|eukprot:CAMPEP_0206493308 /NCGR_PEP_ID=MMETSP0324_2-20121206/46858_1 /ASSEMBLY_ACC=CAM_ASM_000836 /TAXON_ID=2866 /ORGANISM="Crypthecodinium cohnii, Strain Seligo" /LENGTH=279 /DNA_ID=CAMNT_0053976353 /DNA_START=190 /DNA_END=1029 /DNA_ORIENTATION=-
MFSAAYYAAPSAGVAGFEAHDNSPILGNDWDDDLPPMQPLEQFFGEFYPEPETTREIRFDWQGDSGAAETEGPFHPLDVTASSMDPFQALCGFDTARRSKDAAPFDVPHVESNDCRCNDLGFAQEASEGFEASFGVPPMPRLCSFGDLKDVAAAEEGSSRDANIDVEPFSQTSAPPRLATCPFGMLEPTSIEVETADAASVANAALDFFRQCKGTRRLTKKQANFTIHTEVQSDSVDCELKLRFFEVVPGRILVEAQRRAGDSLMFVHIFHRLRVALTQ